MTTELKPCPFCGGVGKITHEVEPGTTHGNWAVRCVSCAAEGGWSKHNADGAVHRWNKRTELDRGHPPCHARDEFTPLTTAEKRGIARLVALVEAEHRVRDEGREDGRPPEPERGVP